MPTSTLKSAMSWRIEGTRSAVVQLFPNGTPDGDIDVIARVDGWIIVSHDRRFMRAIQQPRYNFDIAVTTGYGRVMLCRSESGRRIRDRQSA